MLTKFCYYAFGLKFPLYLLYLLPLFIFYNPIKKLFKIKYFRIVFFLIPATLIFIKLLRNDPFFLSDDFAHLGLVSSYSYLEIAQLALTKGIWVGHRIFTAFWLFKGIFDIFGTRVEAYLFANYLLHVINLILFYRILEKLKKNTFVSVFLTFILGSFYLTWISNMHELLGGVFVLLAFLYWLRFLKKESGVWIVTAFYLLALISKEITFLLVPALFIFSIYYYFNVKAIKIGEVAKKSWPLLALFSIYTLFYASGFLYYGNLPSDEGYKLVLSGAILFRNLAIYSSMLVPSINASYIGLALLVSLFIGFDIWKRKPAATPFLLIYILFLTPPSFFANRVSNYYVYIASFFLFIGLAVIMWEFSKWKIFSHKAVTLLAILVIAGGFFGVNRILMDNCFLIQFPWRKEYKQTFLALTKKLDVLSEKNELEKQKEITLTSEEKTVDMESLYESNIIQLFLSRKEARNLRFIYNKDRGVIIVDAK